MSASSVAAGCGGHAAAPPPAPHFARSDASQLVALAGNVTKDAPGDACAADNDIAAFKAKVDQLVAAGRIPTRLRAHLLVGVAALAADAPPCTPPAPTPPAPHGKPHGPKPRHDHGPGHGHGHGHGKDG
ncbi:MAG TPA: hypothetical protein VGL76_04515 [Gaiellaceae bacterium]